MAKYTVEYSTEDEARKAASNPVAWFICLVIFFTLAIKAFFF